MSALLILNSRLRAKLSKYFQASIYWKERAKAAEQLARYEPSDPKTYSKYLEAKERLDKLKEQEDDYK